MLTAEENVALPLTIAGEKPDKAWLEQLIESVGLKDRRKHRPVRALRRPAAARRDRARARLEADRRLRRRADRQPRLEDRRRDPRAAARTRSRTTGQTTVMVTHDPRSASIADRILFLADGDIVKELPRSDPRDVDRRDGRDRRDVIRSRSAGSGRRKLRTILTGVRDRARDRDASAARTSSPTRSRSAFDEIFSSIYVGTDASITGKSAVSARTRRPTCRRSTSRCSRRCRQLPDVQAAVGGVGDTANLIGENGKVISFGGAPHLGFSVDPTPARVQLAHARRGRPGRRPARS